MAESAALLVDEVLPHQPMCQLLPWMASIRAMQENQWGRESRINGVSINVSKLRHKLLIMLYFAHHETSIYQIFQELEMTNTDLI